MEKTKSKKPLSKLLLLLVIVLVVVAAVAVILTMGSKKPADANQTDDIVHISGDVEAVEMEETPGIPLATNYILLSYPAELEEDVTVSYENLKDGQKITFTTDFTGEELELFHFTISTSSDEGYFLGTLKDKEAGDLMVCMNVHEYTNGNWKPEDFNKLNAMQERVNDIIVQFHEDERFVPNR